jgi:UDP-N-acetylglucosamine:LPS N-acetylglucosamine transferase
LNATTAKRPRTDTAPAEQNADVLLVCHSGGHLVQLVALRAAWDGYRSAWVTDDSSDARSLLEGERVYYGFGPAARSAINFVHNLALAWRLIVRLKPKLVVSTGAAMCIPFAVVARLRGVDVFYIETVSRVDGPSLTCRLIRPFASRVYVQWPELERRVRGSIYVGSVFATK